MSRQAYPASLLALGLLAVLVFGPLGVRLAGSAFASQVAACAAEIDGVPVEQYADHDRALELRPDDSIRVAFASTSDATGTVEVEFGPLSFEVASFETTGGAWLSAPVDVGEHARGAGLYRVVVNATGCEPIAGWVHLTGTNPLTTPIGGSAAAAAAAGALSVIGAAFRGMRARKGLVLALIGGALIGLGGCVLDQQFGNTPLSWSSLAMWMVPSTLLAGVVNRGAALLGGRREDREVAPPKGSWPNGEPVPPPRGGGGYPWDARTPRPPSPRPPATANGGAPPRTANGGGGGAVSVEQPSAPSAARPPAEAPTSASPPGGLGIDPRPPASSAPAPGGAEHAPAAEPETAGAEPLPEMSEEPVAANGGGSHVEEAAPLPSVQHETYAAHGLLDCPPVVVAAKEFALEVGVAPEAVTGVTGEAFELPVPAATESYELTVDLDLEGFRLRPGESPRQTLLVTDATRYPLAVVHLVATPPEGDTPDIRSVRALYIIGGAVVGYARRHVAVVGDEADLAGTPDPPDDDAGTVAIPQDRVPADLTVVIEEDEQTRGRLRWTLTTPHTSLPPAAPMVTDIGDDPQRFARHLIDGVGAREGGPGLAAYLRGVGHTIAEEFPPGFWPVLQSVAEIAAAEDRPPTVFLLSEEPYVPWELAIVEPRLDPAAPPFLGAQAQVGRWVLGTRRPKLPPPAEVAVSSIAVISGEYSLPGWSRLAEAEAEAAALQSLYSAVPVNALTADVLKCLGGEPPAELLHFAMHGIYDPNSTLNGLVLADGQTIDPLQVRGLAFTKPPFVFLNACQVGSSQRILGDYAGLAEAFLFSGAAGVIAPLWSIKDTIAREIALRFYEQIFEGVPPAEILRRERGAFTGGPEVVSATSLAYLFYGHPSLLLRKITEDTDA